MLRADEAGKPMCQSCAVQRGILIPQNMQILVPVGTMFLFNPCVANLGMLVEDQICEKSSRPRRIPMCHCLCPPSNTAEAMPAVDYVRLVLDGIHDLWDSVRFPFWNVRATATDV